MLSETTHYALECMISDREKFRAWDGLYSAKGVEQIVGDGEAVGVIEELVASGYLTPMGIGKYRFATGPAIATQLDLFGHVMGGTH